jgi:hypothetical protein
MIKRFVNYIGNPDNSKKLKWSGFAALVVVVVADFLVNREHALYVWDKIPGWSALYGFISCAVIILVSKFIGHQGRIMKKEDYYDD